MFRETCIHKIFHILRNKISQNKSRLFVTKKLLQNAGPVRIGKVFSSRKTVSGFPAEALDSPLQSATPEHGL